jgi:hypothetical protein
MKDSTIGQKKNERPTFGKTNPFEPMEHQGHLDRGGDRKEQEKVRA